MNFGQVQFAAAIATIDTTGDADFEPDIIPVTGYVEFIPSRVVTYSDILGRTLILGPQRFGVDNEGIMKDPNGNDTVVLIASDSPELSHQGWSYEAYISLNGVDPIGPYPFVLHKDDFINLGNQAPVDITNGVAILRGPPGPEGPAGPPGGGGGVDSVNGKTGAVTLTAGDVGVVNASSTVNGLLRLAGDLTGTATSPKVKNKLAVVVATSTTDTPTRPATSETAGGAVFITPDSNRPATNGTAAGGAFAAAAWDILVTYT